LRSAQTIRGTPIAKVFGGREILVQGQFLRDDTQPLAGGAALADDVVPQHSDAARRWFEQAGDAADGGRFARPVRPEQAEDLARLGGEADTADGRHVAIFLFEIFDFDHRPILPETFGL
jgi:hypothetical protein